MLHRIDAVPEVGRRIRFAKERDDFGRTGQVVRLNHGDKLWHGIGDDVRIDPDDSTGVLLIPSHTFNWWAYVALALYGIRGSGRRLHRWPA